MQLACKRRECGKVRMIRMKCHNALQADLSSQAHSKNLRLYAKIGLSEQGKVLNEK